MPKLSVYKGLHQDVKEEIVRKIYKKKAASPPSSYLSTYPHTMSFMTIAKGLDADQVG